MAEKQEVVTRQCPVCHEQKAQIQIKETGTAQTGKVETWKHIGANHSKQFKTS